MASGSSDLVRTVALEKYVRPAMREGKTRFSVAVKDLMKDLLLQGFPAGNYPQICTAIQTQKFLREQGLEIAGIDGPPKGLSPTVVVHYSLQGTSELGNHPNTAPKVGDDGTQLVEDRVARGHRLFEGLRGILKEELAEYGGGEAFIRWMRSEDDEQAPSGSGK